jgi:hypothetical protein
MIKPIYSRKSKVTRQKALLISELFKIFWFVLGLVTFDFLEYIGLIIFLTIKYATLEANGQLGYELKDDCKPLTIKDLKKVIGLLISELFKIFWFVLGLVTFDFLEYIGLIIFLRLR